MSSMAAVVELLPLCIMKLLVMFFKMHYIFSDMIVTKLKMHYSKCRFLVNIREIGDVFDALYCTF